MMLSAYTNVSCTSPTIANEESIMSCFSGFMYRDTLQPLMSYCKCPAQLQGDGSVKEEKEMIQVDFHRRIKYFKVQGTVMAL